MESWALKKIVGVFVACWTAIVPLATNTTVQPLTKSTNPWEGSRRAFTTYPLFSLKLLGRNHVTVIVGSSSQVYNRLRPHDRRCAQSCNVKFDGRSYTRLIWCRITEDAVGESIGLVHRTSHFQLLGKLDSLYYLMFDLAMHCIGALHWCVKDCV